MKIGIIGLGGMGGGMASRLLGLGQDVCGFDPGADQARAFAAAGGRSVGSAREVAEQAEIVIACLPSQAASFATAFGEEGVAGASAIRTYVEMSTLGKEAMETIAAELKASGVAFLDCPISGGPRRAKEGTLTAILAGDPHVRKTALPVLRMLAEHVFEVGDIAGQAQVVKLVNNMLSITAFVASCEAISIGVKAGLDARTMIDVINVSTGRNSATVDKFPAAILPRNFKYGGPLSIGVKDIELFLKLARQERMPAFVGSTVANLFGLIAEQLGPEADYSNTIKVFEAWGGGIVVGDATPPDEGLPGDR